MVGVGFLARTSPDVNFYPKACWLDAHLHLVGEVRLTK